LTPKANIPITHIFTGESGGDLPKLAHIVLKRRLVITLGGLLEFV
tara:strand:- start:415 stop:549 length:135 start_codon:yes stop_codon:yes gene_type:complete